MFPSSPRSESSIRARRHVRRGHADRAQHVALKLEVTEWEKNRIIKLSSLGGVSNSSTWEFAAIDDSKTELSVDFAYKLPGGIAGKALGRLIGPFVENAVKNSEETLRHSLEEQFAARGEG
ncbi:hypothetical protein GCM10020255_029120 [Rhodococcus baikonurensis]